MIRVREASTAARAINAVTRGVINIIVTRNAINNDIVVDVVKTSSRGERSICKSGRRGGDLRTNSPRATTSAAASCGAVCARGPASDRDGRPVCEKRHPNVGNVENGKSKTKRKSVFVWFDETTKSAKVICARSRSVRYR